MNTLDLDTLPLAAGHELQQSAHELVDRMLAITEGDPA